MINATYDLALDIQQVAPVQTNIKMTQGDVNAYRLNITVTDNSAPIDLAQVDVGRIMFAKADHNFVQGELTKTSTGFAYTLGTNEIAAPGLVYATVMLYGPGGERICTSNFTFAVVRDPVDPSAVQSSTEFDALQQAIWLMQQLETKLANFPSVKMLGTYPTLADLQATHSDGSELDGGFFVTDTSEFYIWDINTSAWGSIGVVSAGPPGPQGAPGQNGAQGVGMPAGGISGQVLVKATDGDYDVAWGNGGQSTSGFTNVPLEPVPMWITFNTVMLENQPLEDGDTYLLTFYLYGDTHKSSNFSIVYAVNTAPEELDNTRSEATVHFFKGYSGKEYRLDLFVEFSLNALRASTDCDNLFLVRAGFMPAFGPIGL